MIMHVHHKSQQWLFFLFQKIWHDKIIVPNNSLVQNTIRKNNGLIWQISDKNILIMITKRYKRQQNNDMKNYPKTVRVKEYYTIRKK